METREMKKTIVRTSLAALVFLAAVTGFGNAEEKALFASETDQAGLILEAVKQNYLASLRMEALKTGNIVPESNQVNISASQWMRKVKANEVNMVTNRYSKESQVKVNLGGKTYYAQDEHYAATLTKNQSLCFAKDPITNKIVDKAEAVIYVDASGRAFYFGSDDSFNNFLALAEQDMTYGYSETRE